MLKDNAFSEKWSSLAADLHTTQSITNPTALTSLATSHIQQLLKGR